MSHHQSNKKDKKFTGLKRLRYYCEMCNKQCSDQHSFDRHSHSQTHIRNMQLFRDNPDKFTDDYSKSFESQYIDVLKRRSLNTYINANTVYNDMITSDKTHTHMNATKWSTLSDFIQYLGKTGKADVERGKQGDHDIWLIKYKSNIQSTHNNTQQHRTYNNTSSSNGIDSIIDKQINALKRNIQYNNNNNDDTTDIQHSTIDHTIRHNLNLSLNNNNSNSVRQHSSKQADTVQQNNTLFNTVNDDDNNLSQHINKKQKLSEYEKIALESQQRKQQQLQQQQDELHKNSNNVNDTATSTSTTTAEQQGWLYPHIIVKIMNRQLDNGKYYKQKAEIIKTYLNNTVAECNVLTTNDIIRLSQNDLETVIPNINKHVMILYGKYQQRIGVLIDINESKYSCSVKLDDDTAVDNLQYEQVCKIVTR